MTMLSVIVPVYNKVRYLDECIRSILDQTYSDFELILVNDGSTDGSDSICWKYAETDRRIHVISQVNSGVSNARNAGMEAASGKYIGFIDADDTIKPDMYELLIRNIEKYKADVSVCRLQSLNHNKAVHLEEQAGVLVLDRIQAIAASLKGELDRSANNKIYKARMAKGEKFEGSIYEDILYTNKVFLKAEKTVVENLVKYHYRIRDNSVSMQTFHDGYRQTAQISSQLVEMVSTEAPACLEEAYLFDLVTNLSLLNLLLLSSTSTTNPLYIGVVCTLRKYQQFINASALLSKKHKYALKLFHASPIVYTTLLNWYCRLNSSDALTRTRV